MNLKLKNIGIIEKADIKLNGLTVIAGKNDSGKSTVGKVLYSCIKTIKWASNTSNDDGNIYCNYLNRYIKSLFKNQIAEDGHINFEYNNFDFDISVQKNRCTNFTAPKNYNIKIYLI